VILLSFNISMYTRDDENESDVNGITTGHPIRYLCIKYCPHFRIILVEIKSV